MAASLRFVSPLLGWRFAAAAKPLYSSRQPQRGHRLTPSDDEMYQKTTIKHLERESQDIMFIESYNCWGFNINGNKVLGPCAVLPRAILQWNVGTHKDITAESLTLFRLLEPRIEIIVLGTGNKVERLDPAVLKVMRQCGIAVEVQDTPNACATFNFLTNERRVAAAGLIPPLRNGQSDSAVAVPSDSGVRILEEKKLVLLCRYVQRWDEKTSPQQFQMTLPPSALADFIATKYNCPALDGSG